MSSQPSLVLIGFMASGKTTVGRYCARALGLPFRDTDTLVERRARMTVAEIFAQHGESRFRAMEASAVRTLASKPPVVLSTGGGVPLNSANVAALRRTGLVILLWADVPDILARLGNRPSRPLLMGQQDPEERIREMLAHREPFYRAAANVVVDTSAMCRDEAVQRVLQAYRSRLPSSSGQAKDSGRAEVRAESEVR